MTNSGPWTGWVYDTIEADPTDSDELISARAWTVALEQRIEEIRRFVCNRYTVEVIPGSGSWRADLLEILDAELTA